MPGILVYACLFFVLLTVPLFGALAYYRLYKAKILFINQNKIRDVRYFGKSFSHMIESRLDEAADHKIQLSKAEEFIEADENKDFPENVEVLVIAREKDFCIPPETRRFEKEIYAAKNFYSASREPIELRAVYSGQNMILPENTSIIRWADSYGTLAVYDNCDLGVQTSARKRMCIGMNCSFQRLYAPEIYLGQYPSSLLDERTDKDPRIYQMGIQSQKQVDVRYISKDMIDENGVVDFNVVAKGNLEILEHIIVNGDIRSHKGVRLYDGAIVCGNIFAEKDIYLGRHSAVLGNVFSQGNIYFEEGALAGRRNRISSVIARGRIVFEKNNFVFGYVSCDKGKVLSGDVKKDTENSYKFLGEENFTEYLLFKDLKEYAAVDGQGFRLYDHLKGVTIPAGALKIMESMFYSCSNLEQADIPEELEEIDSHAFQGCTKLKEISLGKLKNLKKIGDAAFEGCESLEEIVLPRTLQTLGKASFSNCKNLK